MRDGTIAVIPAYNEELTIGSVVLRTKEHVDSVIVVDDGSSDRTAEIARAAGAEVLMMGVNGGKASALMRGLRRAKESSPGCVFTLDADWQHNPDQIPSIAAPLISDEADLVIGSRFLGNGANVPMYRQIGHKTLNGFTNLGSNQKLTDTQSGFRGLGARALENIDFDSEGFGVESDMILHFASRGVRVKEVPITVDYEVPNSHKKNPVVHGVSVLNEIVKVVGYKRPLAIFGIPGLILFTIGLFLGLASFFETTIFHWSWLTQTIAAVFLFTLGAVLGVSALILNSLARLMEIRNEHNDFKSSSKPSQSAMTVAVPTRNKESAMGSQMFQSSPMGSESHICSSEIPDEIACSGETA